MPRTTSQSSSCDHEKGVACDLCIQHGPGDICGGYCERTVANSWRKLRQYKRPWCEACASQLERDMTTRQNLITHIARQMYVCPSEFDVCALPHMLRFSDSSPRNRTKARGLPRCACLVKRRSLSAPAIYVSWSVSKIDAVFGDVCAQSLLLMPPRVLNPLRVNDDFILSAAPPRRPSRDQTRPSRDQTAARGTRHKHKQWCVAPV